MALEDTLVGGASGILKTLVSFVASETSLAWGIKDELKKVKDTLEVIDAKISDVERKQVNDAEVLLRLKRLKGASYDADDVLDKFSYEVLRRSENRNGKFQSTSDTSRYDAQIAEKRKRLTASFFGDDSNIVGRGHDKSELIKLLTSSSSVYFNQQEKVSVISTVGMGGWERPLWLNPSTSR
ncbi:putative disease resistance protein RGA1 isoform X3 [Papaver somniferum]|uniref:putative disease resistance protein RGA1 isoform X3 n=1 Tax=Papaver somniferum TaxID=3469 RepID=UPI000E6F81E5|nr:putative disease resistance protein RGA1 isoform X3 [Papaver somniferum]